MQRLTVLKIHNNKHIIPFKKKLQLVYALFFDFVQ